MLSWLTESKAYQKSEDHFETKLHCPLTIENIYAYCCELSLSVILIATGSHVTLQKLFCFSLNDIQNSGIEFEFKQTFQLEL